MAVSQPWYWNENTLEDNTARLQEGLPPHSSRPHHLPLLPHPLLLPQDPLLPPGGQPSSYPCPLKPVSCLLAVKATLLSAIASKSLCPHSDSSLNSPTTMVIRSPYWSSCCRILPPFFKSVGFKDIEYDIPLAHGTIAVTAGISQAKEDAKQQCCCALAAACWAWLIPAGKLVSAHHAWRPTPRGGGVSGGRQWAGGGPPRLVCDPPRPVCDHLNDASSYFHHLALKSDCCSQHFRHHCTVYDCT